MSLRSKLDAQPERSAIVTDTTLPTVSKSGQASRAFAILLVVLVGVYALPLYRLVRYSLENDLWSHVLLVPWISLYLVWLRKSQLPPAAPSFSFYAAVPLLGGVAAAVSLSAMKFNGTGLTPANSISITILSFVLFLMAIAAWVSGPVRTRALAFPLAFLIFMVPFPTFITHAVEVFFQHASADAASLLLAISQTPVLRDGLFFKLPGITVEVAEECSGIRSTLVLFITSLVGAYLFFQSRTHRALLASAVIPIAIIRNGLRIFTIAMLCVHVSPEMIHSWIHRRGGPFFFLLSLIPFFALLLFLYRRERKARKPERAASPSGAASSQAHVSRQ